MHKSRILVGIEVFGKEVKVHSKTVESPGPNTHVCVRLENDSLVLYLNGHKEAESKSEVEFWIGVEE